eukprot:2311356-Rhodomonas_salina.2
MLFFFQGSAPKKFLPCLPAEDCCGGVRMNLEKLDLPFYRLRFPKIDLPGYPVLTPGRNPTREHWHFAVIVIATV